MILFAMIRRRDSFITWYSVKRLFKLLSYLHLLCLRFIHAHTSCRPMTFMHIGSEHDPRSLSPSHLLTLIGSLFISGIWRRLPTSGTPRILLSTLERTILIHGHRPTLAKSLSLGEYVFFTDITFMFTHSCQLSVLILFHCTIHASLFSVLSFLVCLKNFEKIQNH